MHEQVYVCNTYGPINVDTKSIVKLFNDTETWVDFFSLFSVCDTLKLIWANQFLFTMLLFEQLTVIPGGKDLERHTNLDILKILFLRGNMFL